MPYNILVEIERLAIRDQPIAFTFYENLKVRIQNLNLKPYQKILQDVGSQSVKRERYAPSFHLDDSMLTP